MTSRIPSSRQRCADPACKSTFSSKSNLNRHMRSKHGPMFRTACEKEIPNHSSNIRRHMKTCDGCKSRSDPRAVYEPSTKSEDHSDDIESIPLSCEMFQDAEPTHQDFMVFDQDFYAMFLSGQDDLFPPQDKDSKS